MRRDNELPTVEKFMKLIEAVDLMPSEVDTPLPKLIRYRTDRHDPVFITPHREDFLHEL
jgi:hypothetical protein